MNLNDASPLSDCDLKKSCPEKREKEREKFVEIVSFIFLLVARLRIFYSVVQYFRVSLLFGYASNLVEFFVACHTIYL
jgi:hypothetical protein